jgi:hypothetical protein
MIGSSVIGVLPSWNKRFKTKAGIGPTSARHRLHFYRLSVRFLFRAAYRSARRAQSITGRNGIRVS